MYAFILVPPTTLALIHFLPLLPCGSMNSEWWCFMSFRLECFNISLSVCNVSLWISICFRIWCRRKFLWLLISKALIYEWSRMTLWARLLLHFSFYRALLFGFPLGAWDISSHVLGHLSSVRYGFHLMNVA